MMMIVVIKRIPKDCSLYNVIIAAILNDLRFATHIILIEPQHYADAKSCGKIILVTKCVIAKVIFVSYDVCIY